MSAGAPPKIEEFYGFREERPLDVFVSLLAKTSVPAAFFERKGFASEAHPQTVLAFEPFEVLTCDQDNPFSKISERLRAHARKPHPELPRGIFQGGAIGTVSYESAKCLEPTLVPFGGFSESVRLAEIGFFDELIVFDHARGRVLLIAGDTHGLARLRERCASIAGAIPRPTKWPELRDAQALGEDRLECALGKRKFLDSVARLKEHVRDGDIFQAVLSERFSVPYDGDPARLFGILCDLNPSPYQFFLRLPDRTSMGASPEMLLTCQDGVLETHPIAGTSPRSDDPEKEKELLARLLSDEKEKAEHLMLVDLARNDIGRVSQPGSVRVESYMEVKKLAGLMHLVSRVTGRLRPDLSAIDALQACFPAGTLTGAPKIRAMQLVAEIERSPRGLYGGGVIAAGFDGDLDSCIAIRCIELRDGKATVQVGAGIVADSQPEREYDEVMHKSRAARTALAVQS